MNTSPPRPLLFVEDQPTKLVAEVLLRPYDFEINAGRTVSGALEMARLTLEKHPERPVIVMFKMRDANPVTVEEWRKAAERVLSRGAPNNWLVVPVVPWLDAWALTDPRIKQDFETNGTPKLYADRAARIVELTRKHPFDPTELLRTNEDFRKLVEFLREHAPQPAAATR
jgi:hypothetical protein